MPNCYTTTTNINYSYIMQVNEADPNFRIILITPPQSIEDSKECDKLQGIFGEYVIRIDRIYGLPVIDSFGNMQMNFIDYSIR